MPAFNANVRKLVIDNTDFRRKILTNKHSRIVLMSIEPGDDISCAGQLRALVPPEPPPM